MPPYVQEVGIVALVALVVGDKILGMLKSRGVDLQKLARQIDRLDTMHAKTDADGVPVWYVRRSLENAIVSLNEAIRTQTELLQALTMEVRELHRDVKRVHGEGTTVP